MSERSMEIMSVLSCLLDYPDEQVLLNEGKICRIIEHADLDPELEERLLAFVEQQLAKDLMDWQSEYDGLFERGRSLALWLFEHVHGEGRDRGQAMVDLINVYREAGLEISQHELPDYIPLFFEFLSTQGEDNAKAWLQDVAHILALLQCRLEKRESEYAVLFEAALSIAEAEAEVALEEIREQITAEKRDDSRAAIDQAWQEEEVTFGAESLDKACDSATRRPSEKQRRDQDIPIHWVDFNTGAAATQATHSDSQATG